MALLGIMAALVVAAVLGLVVFFGLAFFAKEAYTNDPNQPKKLTIFTNVTPGRAKLIMRGGQVSQVIIGDNTTPVRSAVLLWDWYKQLCWTQLGLHVLIPYFEQVYTYDLPRYREAEGTGDQLGRKVYTPVVEGDEGYRSDHFRVDPTTWYFNFGGAEVERIPFVVTGSVQYYIERSRVEAAAFKADSWNKLLDQALNSIIRGYVRRLTVDMILGKVSRDIWDGAVTGRRATSTIQNALLKNIQQHVVKKAVLNPDKSVKEAELKLEDFGIVVTRVDINDFEAQLPPDQLKRLQEATLKAQEARGRALAGQGDAEYKRKVAEVLEALPQALADKQLETDALVNMTKNGSLEAAIVAWVNNAVKGK